MYLDLDVGGLAEPVRGRRWESAEVRSEVAVRAARLVRHGMGPGERALLPFGNRLEFFAELLAVWQTGGSAIPLDPRLTPFEVTTLATAARPRVALVDDTTNAPILAALGEAGVTIVNAVEAPSAADVAVGAPRARARLDDEALILFTSGSTGDPKGVVHTHRSLRARWIGLRQALDVESFRRTLCLLPTHFGHGLICNCLFPWLSGCDLFVTPPFQPDLLMRLGSLVDEHRITFLSSVPSMWRVALKLARPPRAGTLSRVHCGSAPLSAGIWQDIRKWSSTTAVSNTYGITETGSWVAGSAGRDVAPEDGLIGEPWGAVIKVLRTRETDVPLSPDLGCAAGESGFVWLNTPALMHGYLDRDDLTEQVVSAGWFMTGDIGMLDERGRLYLRGRERDEINKGGAKIYPADVDAVVERFSQAKDVCTFALDDPTYGQNVGMAVVLDDPGHATIAALHAWMKQHLAEPKMPVRWYLVDAIPRTSRGKINRDSVKASCAGLTPVDLTAILGAGRGASV